MLKVLRENVKYLSWILWVVIGVFVLFVFVDFGGGVSGLGPAQTTAARVGSHKVSLAEFQQQYRETEQRLRQLYGEAFTPEQARQLRLPLRVLDEMVNKQILLAEARGLGLAVTDAELREAILAVPVFKDDKGRFVGDATYAEILKSNNRTVDLFESGLREELLLQKLNNALLANVWVSDQEVERAYRDQTEKAKIRYVQMPRNRFLQGEQIPPAEVQSYYASHQEAYRLPEQREVAYLLVESPKLLDQVKIEEPEMQRYYADRKAEFSQEEGVRARHILVFVNDQRTEEQARTRIEAAKKRIEGGEDFGAVAREISDDEESKQRGGELGFFGRNRMVKEFEDAAFGAEPGKLVGPIRSQYGFHILEVEEKRAGGTMPFEQARIQIQARLAAERVRTLAEQKAQQLAAKLKDQKPKGPEALEALAKEDKTLTFAKSGRFGQNEPIAGLGFAPELGTAAFALEKGKISEPVQVPRGWAVLYLLEIHAPRVPPLAEVEPRVRLAVAADKQQERAMAELAKAKQQLEGGKTFEQVAQELGLEVKTSEELGGDGNIPGLGYNPQLAQAALALQPGQIGGPQADAQGAVLFQVAERKGWNPQEFQANREQTKSGLEQERLNRLLATLVEQRRRELGVEYDRQLLQSFGIVGDPATGSAG
jgi:peptidyl-prolyl cis-trans isomerase D